MDKKNFYLFLIPLILFIGSCREEIIPPDNPGENINEPTLLSNVNTYIFSINAINISKSYIYNIPFNAVTTRLFSLLEDHSSGFVEIAIRSRQQVTLYSGVLSQNNIGSSFNVEGNYQETILIRFVNFTGKLRVQLSPAR